METTEKRKSKKKTNGKIGGKLKNMRQVDIKISGRKIEGYPTVTRTIKFNNVEEFISKADEAIDETDFGKVDCYVDNFDNVFNDEEIKLLEEQWFIIE